jgi:hypothetical protein
MGLGLVGLEFRLLGPVEVQLDGRPVPLVRPQLRTVLAALATEAGRPVSTDTLADRVWDGSPPGGARGVLYSHITRLRGALTSAQEGPHRCPWYAERPDMCWISTPMTSTCIGFADWPPGPPTGRGMIIDG